MHKLPIKIPLRELTSNGRHVKTLMNQDRAAFEVRKWVRFPVTISSNVSHFIATWRIHMPLFSTSSDESYLSDISSDSNRLINDETYSNW